MIPKYTINLLSSLSRWLQGKSETIWAKSFGHSTTMRNYAKSLNDVVDYIKANHKQCERCGGTDGPVLREFDPLDCHCVARSVVIDASTGESQELNLVSAHTNVTVKFPEAGLSISLILKTGSNFKSVEFDWLAPAHVILAPNTSNLLTFVSVSHGLDSVGYLLYNAIYDFK